MFTITIDLPDLPKGTEVDIDGLGTFENGGSYDITDDENYDFQVRHQTISTVTSGAGHVSNTLVLGPALDEAFANHKHIKVEEAKSKDVKKSKDEKPVVVANSEGSEN